MLSDSQAARPQISSGTGVFLIWALQEQYENDQEKWLIGEDLGPLMREKTTVEISRL